MQKIIKYGIIFILLHLIIFTAPLYIYGIPGKYGGVLFLPTMVIYIYEAPLFFINKILSVPINYENIKFVIFNCIFGSILYFFIGAFIAYVRNLPKSSKK